jgi:hypothetical protein
MGVWKRFDRLIETSNQALRESDSVCRICSDRINALRGLKTWRIRGPRRFKVPYINPKNSGLEIRARLCQLRQRIHVSSALKYSASPKRTCSAKTATQVLFPFTYAERSKTKKLISGSGPSRDRYRGHSAATFWPRSGQSELDFGGYGVIVVISYPTFNCAALLLIGSLGNRLTVPSCAGVFPSLALTPWAGN